ncbi:MAG: type IV pilin protein [Thiohalobacterales bacterium]|nr:type IV pilin protein [Thiohalobacterales bacterium]
MNRQQGMTLVELLVVLVVISLLVGIAYPSYSNQVRQTRRADCEGTLMALSSAMERYFTQNNTYAGATLSGANAIFPGQCPIDGGTAFYNLAITNLTATTYTVTATPAGSQTKDSCGTLSLTQTGLKAASGGTIDQCWK